MLLEKINLQQKLEQFRNKETTEKALLEEVRSILKAEQDQEEKILQRIENGDGNQSNNFEFDLLESGRIYHLSHIKEICSNYRLRFLNTRYFKGELPHEAVIEVKKLEKAHNIILQGFHILAPAEYFRLEDADDPILFAPLGNGYFYLIYKWGRDLHPLRRIMMWPLKNVETLAIFSLLFSFLMTFVIREVFFARFRSDAEFIILFMYTFKSVVGLTLFYGISLGKNFSSAIWNSKFYNA